MRLSRHCYDKPHRCPGWAGGGTHYPKGESRCDSGHIAIDYDSRWYRWVFHHCDSCDVVCWPIHVQKLDPSWWRWMPWWRLRTNLVYAWRDRRYHTVRALLKLHLDRLAWRYDQQWGTNMLYLIDEPKDGAPR